MKGSEQNSERFSLAKWFGTEFRGIFSSTDRLGTQFRNKLLRVSRNNFFLRKWQPSFESERKNKVRCEPKRTETQSVSVVFRFVSRKKFLACFDVSNL
jgi:hypothetical protein